MGQTLTLSIRVAFILLSSIKETKRLVTSHFWVMTGPDDL